MARKKKKKKQQQPARMITPLRLELSLPRLEMARGHDGLLRGEPEPVIVLGAYSARGDSVRALGRTHVRFAPRGSYPLVVTTESATLTAPVLPPSGDERLVVLAIALEEDNGEDVARVYGAMENGASFAVWSHHEAEPAPRSLGAEFDAPVTRVFVLEEGRELACRGDELIGAVVATLPMTRSRHELRLPFSSERNDWVAVLEAAIR